MQLDGHTDRAIAAMVSARGWRDPAYRQRLSSDPRGVLSEEGIDLLDGVEVRVVEDTATMRYVDVSVDARDGEPENLAAILEPLLDAGTEVRLVQSTAALRYIVIGAPPPGRQLVGTAVSDYNDDTLALGEVSVVHTAETTNAAESTNAQAIDAVEAEVAVTEHATEAVTISSPDFVSVVESAIVVT
jgi:hypothetical protein